MFDLTGKMALVTGASGGITSGPPETHSSTTVSPDCTVTTGGTAASKMPHRTVRGVAATRCIAMSASESSCIKVQKRRKGSKNLLFLKKKKQKNFHPFAPVSPR